MSGIYIIRDLLSRKLDIRLSAMSSLLLAIASPKVIEFRSPSCPEEDVPEIDWVLW
jgi:hypothetical protein